MSKFERFSGPDKGKKAGEKLVYKSRKDFAAKRNLDGTMLEDGRGDNQDKDLEYRAYEEMLQQRAAGMTRQQCIDQQKNTLSHSIAHFADIKQEMPKEYYEKFLEIQNKYADLLDSKYRAATKHPFRFKSRLGRDQRDQAEIRMRMLAYELTDLTGIMDKGIQERKALNDMAKPFKEEEIEKTDNTEIKEEEIEKTDNTEIKEEEIEKTDNTEIKEEEILFKEKKVYKVESAISYNVTYAIKSLTSDTTKEKTDEIQRELQKRYDQLEREKNDIDRLGAKIDEEGKGLGAKIDEEGKDLDRQKNQPGDNYENELLGHLRQVDELAKQVEEHKKKSEELVQLAREYRNKLEELGLGNLDEE